MKVYLLKDVEKVGLAGELIKVKDGHAFNYLIPNKMAIEITPANEKFYSSRIKKVEHRKEAIATATSMLAEKIKLLSLSLKRKTHDGEKLYASIKPNEIVTILSDKGISISKNQIAIDKTIKTVGTFDVTIKLSSNLKPKFKLKIVSE